MRFLHLSLPLLALGTAALGASGCGNSPSDNAAARTPPPNTTATTAQAAALPTAETVELSEWAITPSGPVVRAGRVTFTVQNTGKASHEMVVIRTDKPSVDLGSGSRISEKGSVGETGDVAAGATKRVSLRLTPGHYALICNLPGHYMSGMHADLTVR